MVGQVLSHYRIIEEISRGGMGIVYRAEGFKRIAESGAEHILWPIPYVRSFYFLGKIHENRGEIKKSREYYRRFYEFWKDGDMDRERVEEAKQKLHELEAAS